MLVVVVLIGFFMPLPAQQQWCFLKISLATKMSNPLSLPGSSRSTAGGNTTGKQPAPME
jgi:hypothetical protein